ncbi:hypothetical protein QBC38DRAFT_462117 [Podospora fimiseda]|uniref:Nephrocystin 3-like N-terminal domain-containing protein n=1 Tax=Podospora fimiseda TaxID=252190 RepID=A0AAN6YN77_9PEZI|nr:hypothetical protein QBC38DRAFT_462117 [Podospora fimiseda]
MGSAGGSDALDPFDLSPEDSSESDAGKPGSTKLSVQYHKPQDNMDDFYHQLLRELKFGWMDPHFGGLLDDDDPSGFAQWLREGDGLFWISGKPGSGKPTLIKMIVESEKTHSFLREWAKGKECDTVTHMFWLHGSNIQRNLEGCLRSILYQTLIAQPNPQAEVVTLLKSSFGTPATGLNLTLSAMAELLEMVCGSSRRLCLFIDALDEFDGDTGSGSGLPASEPLLTTTGLNLAILTWEDRELVLTGGLLSVEERPHLKKVSSPGQLISYMHRTARVFLQDWLQRYSHELESDFDPAMLLLESCVLQLKKLEMGTSSGATMWSDIYQLECWPIVDQGMMWASKMSPSMTSGLLRSCKS